MKHLTNPIYPSLVFSAVLAACGGGGSDPAAVAPPPPPATVALDGRVVDGPISGARVCLDTGNGAGGAPNGLCDTGEPQTTTNAVGRYTFEVPASDAARFAVVAVAGAGASDVDRPGETLNFILTAPPGRSAVISPLTTVVQAYAVASGLSVNQAEAAVQSQLGISGSLFADYSAPTTPEAQRTAEIGRIIALTREIQADQAAAALASGAINRADLERLLNAQQIQALDQIAATAPASGTQTLAQTREAANSVAASTGLTSTTVAGAVAANNAMAAATPDAEAAAPTASSRLSWFNFSSITQYFLNIFTATAAESTPDANAMVRFREVRDGAGLASNQSLTRNTFRYFNGTAWLDCPIGTQGTQTVRNAMGIATGVSACGFGFTTQRSVRNIANASMSDIVREFRGWPYPNGFAPTGTTNYAGWGPSPTDPLIAGASFPAGSQIFYQTNSTNSTPNGYDTSAIVRVSSADVHAGNTAGCAIVGSVTSGAPIPGTIEATTLEQTIALYRGNFCAFTPTTGTPNSGPRNENWSRATLAIGDVPTTAETNPFYSSMRRIQFAFNGNGNGVNYFSCQRRASDGAARNCNPIGTGTYAITPAGDGRVLALSGVPTQASPVFFDRTLVERGGLVFLGSKNKPSVETSIGLNQTASDALFTRLDVPLPAR